MNRLENNIKILDIVKQLAYEYPDMRFHQLLMAIGATIDGDQFYEESKVTLNRIRKTIKDKQEKFNQCKYIKLD